jgi:cyclopropane-fatty-acyl-phospholipid synthase
VKSWVEKTIAAVGSRTEIPFAIRYPDGTESRSRNAAPEFTLVFRNPRAYWRSAAFGHVGFLEAYFADELDIEGSLGKALAAGMEGGIDSGDRPLVWLRNRWHDLMHERVALEGARERGGALRAAAGVLQVLARRPAHALHLRVLDRRHAYAGGGAA